MLFIAYTLKRIVLDMDIAAILGHALIVCTLKRPVLHTYYNYMTHIFIYNPQPFWLKTLVKNDNQVIGH